MARHVSGETTPRLWSAIWAGAAIVVGLYLISLFYDNVLSEVERVRQIEKHDVTAS